MKESQAIDVFDLVQKGETLPDKVEDLQAIILVGGPITKMYQNRLKMMSRIETANEQKEATLKDGQKIGNFVLDAEAKLGELINEARPDHKTAHKRNVKGQIVEKTSHLPKGVTSRDSESARKLADNPEVVTKIKKQAIKNKDIPTKTAVFSEIRYQKEKKRRKEAEGKSKKMRIEIDLDQAKYLTALDRCIAVLPQKPPKDWNPEALAEAAGKAKIIMKRLEVFNDQV